MKTAEAMVQELLRYVRPPKGCAIVLTERPSSGPTDPNWVAAAGDMEIQKNSRFMEKVAELRKTDLEIDWSDAEGPAGKRRVARWLSEIEGDNGRT
jgi:hypothetical protein